MPNIHVIAVITARPGQRQALLDLFNENVPTVKAEAGCIAYEATVDVAGGIWARYICRR